MKNKFGIGFFLAFMAVAFAADDYTQWFHYKDIKINTTSTGAAVTNNVTNIPVLVRLTSTNFSEFGVAGTKASIRFSRGAAHLPYQVERWDSTGGLKAEIWVLVDTVFGNDSTHAIRMSWGKAGAGDSSNGAAVFTASNGYVGAWHLGDAAGIAPRPNSVAGAPAATPSNDASGSTFGGGTGTYVAPEGVIGRADALRGGGTRTGPTSTSDYLDIGSNATGSVADPYDGLNSHTGYSDFSTGFTYSLWVNPGTAAGNYSYMLELSNGSAATDNIQLFRPTTATTFRYEHTNGGTTGGLKSTATGTYVVGTWQHIVVTVGTGATPAVIIYKNGVVSLASSNATIGLATALRTNAWIGKSNYGGDFYWTGSIDEPAISNVTRSADWVKLSYQTQVTGSTALVFGATVDAPPSNLTYSPNPAVYTVGFAIPDNSPTVTGSVVSYSVAPALPAGLTLNTTTGVISGTPTAAVAAANYVVSATNGQGSGTASVNITVNAALVAPTNLSYSTPTAVYGRNTVIPNNNPTVTGTVTNYIVNPGLPAGLSLNATTGVISGTPTVASTATAYTVTASNSAGSVNATVNITVLAPPTALSYSTPTANYPRTVAIANNSPTVTGSVVGYSVSPALPAGLTLNATTGVISGTPTAVTAGATYTVTATNSAGSTTATLSITVYGAPSNLSYSSAINTYTRGTAIPANNPTVTGTVAKYSVSPALPVGIKIDSVTGIISGTPTDTTAGYVSYTITAGNAAGTTTASVLISVAKPPVSISGADLKAFALTFGASRVSFRIPQGAAGVSFSITDMWGRSVWSQKIGGSDIAAMRSLAWNGATNSGTPAAAGLYIVRVKIFGSDHRVSRTLERKISYTP